jgi:hypothetical protein
MLLSDAKHQAKIDEKSDEEKDEEFDLDTIDDEFDLSSYPRTEARKPRETASITYLLGEKSTQSALWFRFNWLNDGTIPTGGH